MNIIPAGGDEQRKGVCPFVHARVLLKALHLDCEPNGINK